MYTEELHELQINDIQNASSLEPSSVNSQQTDISSALSWLPLLCAGCNTTACLGLSFFFFPWLRVSELQYFEFPEISVLSVHSRKCT